MKQFRIQLAIAFIVLVCGVSLIGMVYVLSNKPDKDIRPGIVSVSTPSPIAAPVTTMPSTIRSIARPTMMHAPSLPPTNSNSLHHFATSSPSRGLYLTSSAKVRTIGGGGSGYVWTSSTTSSSRGIAYGGATAMPATSFVSIASSRQVAQPEAQEAPQMAQMASSPRHAPGPPNPPGPLPEDHQLVEHPLGDALMPMLLCASVYGIWSIMYRRRKRLKKNDPR